MTCSYIKQLLKIVTNSNASEEDLALVGQDVEDGQELPNSQQQEEELPELSASQLSNRRSRCRGVEASSCPCTCLKEEEGQVASSSAAPEQNELR